MSLKKIKSLFWVSEGSGPQTPTARPDEQGDAAGAGVLEDEFALPAGDSSPTLPSGKRIGDIAKTAGVPSIEGAAGPHAGQGGEQAATIDFQELYDQAEVPNTDEVEALEKFLAGLEDSLPQASKLAASKAFLGAIGKSTDHVLNDAAQKIRVVRALLKSKEDETNTFVEGEQKKIAMFERQIEKHRVAMEQAGLALEGVRRQCTSEEGRLQAARVFFGHMSQEVK